MKKLVLYGSQDFAQIVKNIANDCGRKVYGFIDDINKGDNIIGNFEMFCNNFSPNEYEIAIAIGYLNLKARSIIIKKILDSKYSLATLIHPMSYISDTAEIGQGSIIMARATVDMRSVIGNGVVCWPGSIINHHCEIKDNIFISPGAVICGFCYIGSNTFIGANSTIINNKTISSNSFIKAGVVYK